jgi:SAM-dependent methyltransferase
MRKNVNRLYTDLAWLWPLWEDVEVYKKESQIFAKLIKKYAQIKVRTLLDMGCGGGKNMFHFRKYFSVTGIDISRAMLRNAKNLNPRCRLHTADIRDFDLRRRFDSVFVNDSVTYITSKKDLLKVFQTAYKHLRPGGAMITCPDECKESFEQDETTVWTSSKDDMHITFIEKQNDPDPEDNKFEKNLVYLIRDKGELRIEHDCHICGLFDLNVWRSSLKKAGFEVNEEPGKEEVEGSLVFCCIKPKTKR